MKAAGQNTNKRALSKSIMQMRFMSKSRDTEVRTHNIYSIHFHHKPWLTLLLLIKSLLHFASTPFPLLQVDDVIGHKRDTKWVCDAGTDSNNFITIDESYVACEVSPLSLSIYFDNVLSRVVLV